MLLLVCSAAALPGQPGSVAPVVTLGMPAPVVDQPMTVFALVTNPSLSPAPTGSVLFDFGDGTPTVNVPMTYRVAAATHTYSAVGVAKITATYSGDTNFSAGGATVSGQVLNSAPPVMLNVFGDSISAAGDAVYADAVNWVTNVAYVQNWTLNNWARGGYKIADECPFIYDTTIAPNSYTAMLIGQNDFWGYGDLPPAGVLDQFLASVTSCSAWLLIPETAADGSHPKVNMQDPSVAQVGNWQTSALFPSMGLETTEAGDTLTTSLAGSAFYLGLSGMAGENYTVDVTVDGALAGEYSPGFFTTGNVTQNIPFGVRIPVASGASTTMHTIVIACKDPGTSGCFVDWIGGNAFVAPNQNPLLWLGEPYQDDQSGHTYAEILEYVQGIRQIGQQFAADGMGVYLADVFDNFNGHDDTICLADLVHPAACGHQILAATFLNAMNPLFTQDQRIDLGTQTSFSFTSSPLAVEAAATSGLPTTLEVVSGPASLTANGIVPTAVGSVTIAAGQAGNASYLPAATATETIQITPAPVNVAIAPSMTSLVLPGTLSVTAGVGWSGSGSVSGAVTLMDGTSTIGTAQLDSTGNANFANVLLTPGSHALSAVFPQQGNFAGASSTPVTVQVIPAPVAVTLTPSTTSVVLPAALSVTAGVTWSGTGAVSGSITLLDGSTTLGTTALDGSGHATFANLQLAQGNHTLTATFAQQGVFAAGTSPAVNVAVQFPPSSLQVAFPDSPVSVIDGQQTTIQLKLTPSLGFTPTVNFACTGLPALTTCQFSQSPLELTPAGANETVTISTTGPAGTTVAGGSGTGRDMRGGAALSIALVVLWPGGLALIRKRRSHGQANRNLRWFLLPLLALIAVGLIDGCGANGPPRTPIGSSTITVTATAVQGSTTLTQTATFDLVVTD